MRMNMNKWIIAAAVMFSPVAAMAHPGHGGLTAGLTHPLTGWDHLLAMLAIGMLAVKFGGRAIWLLPVAFVGALAIGGVLGVAETTFGPVEMVVATSLLVLGGLLAARVTLPLLAGVAMAFVFGLFHGFAHGLEAGAAPGAFLLGMVVASAVLHGMGIVLMRYGQTVWAGRLNRMAGLGIALAGGALLAG